MEIKRFNNIKEFADQKTINKLIYSNMTYFEKKALKNYIYYELQEKNDKRDLIWEYLNEPIDSEYYIYTAVMIGSYSGGKR